MAKAYTVTGQTQGPAPDPQRGGQIVQGYTISFIVPAANNATGAIFFPGTPTADQVDEAISEDAARMIAINGLGGE